MNIKCKHCQNQIGSKDHWRIYGAGLSGTMIRLCINCYKNWKRKSRKTGE